LIERLKEALRNRVGLISDRPGVEVANIAGEGFAPCSYWKLLEPDESDTVDGSIMHIDGIHFREPTTTVQQHNSNFQQRPKKRNYKETFDRLPFIAKRLLPTKTQGGRF